MLTFAKDLRGVAFFLLVPLALTAITATTSGYIDELGLFGALLYVGLLSLIPWWIGEGTTRLVWVGARQLEPPLWVLCVLGVLFASLFVGPYVSMVAAMFKSYWPSDGLTLIDNAANRGALENLLPLARAMVFWTAANYAFDRLLDYPRFRYPISKVDVERIPQTCDAENGLLKRLSKINTLSEILFVEAEEHFVGVHSDRHSELVAYKFGDALEDLKGEKGFQVHRSYWVRQYSVIGITEDGSKLALRLKNGKTVPVSRPYHALVRQVF